MVAFTLAGKAFLALNGGARPERSHAVSFHIDCDNQAEVDRLWNTLCDGGTPVQCGWVRDRYGVSRQIVPRILPALLADPDTAKAGRVTARCWQWSKSTSPHCRRLTTPGHQAGCDAPGV
jgi:predicted 3-demethylubiquinone-9 3-methyltransferase (glyoxalase superfamily)